MRWQDKLTKKMYKHLEDTNALILTKVRANIKFQNDMTFLCWDCVEIARRLDILCPLTAFTFQCMRERRTEEELNSE